MEELPKSVSDFEPHMALYGGEDGLDFYRDITKYYTPLLKPGGFLCYEFGMGQGDAVCAILEAAGYRILERVLDYNDRRTGRMRAIRQEGMNQLWQQKRLPMKPLLRLRTRKKPANGP